MSAIVDSRGIPFSITYYPAHSSDFRTVEPSLANSLIPLIPQSKLYADKGYDSQSARQCFRSHGLHDYVGKRGIQTSKSDNSARVVVEHFFAALDKARRLLLRYDRYLSSYHSFVMLRTCHLIANHL